MKDKSKCDCTGPWDCQCEDTLREYYAGPREQPTVVETEIDETQEEIFDGMFSLYFDLISDKQLSMYEACVEIQKRYTISKKP